MARLGRAQRDQRPPAKLRSIAAQAGAAKVSASSSSVAFPAAFPSILTCSGQNFVDANGFAVPLMGGFNIQATSSTDTRPATIATKLGVTSSQPGLLRVAVFWDSLEPSSGSIDTTTYVPKLDALIANAAANNLYVWLNFYWGPNGAHCPSWANSGSSVMTTYTGGAWGSGQNATQFLAKRYGDISDPTGAGKYTPAVIGIGGNEITPDSTTGSSWMNTLVTQQVNTMATWARAFAPNWILFMCCGHGSSAPQANASGSGHSSDTYTSVVTNPFGGSAGSGNYCLDMHDYTLADTSGTDGRNAQGLRVITPSGTSIAIKDSTNSGGNNYTVYPPVVSGTTLTRATCKSDTALTLASYIAYCAAGNANVPFIIGEMGFAPNDGTTTWTGGGNLALDKVPEWLTANPVAVLEWDYDVTNGSHDPWAAHPGNTSPGTNSDGWQTFTDNVLGALFTQSISGTADEANVAATALQPGTAVTATAGIATVSAVASPPTPALTPSAGLAAVSSVASQASVALTANAGVAAVLAVSSQPSTAVTSPAAVAAALAQASQPSTAITATAGLAVVLAVAPQPTVSVSGATNANAGLAAVSSVASQASVAITATAGLATVQAQAVAPSTALTATAGLAVVLTPASQPTPALTATAGLAVTLAVASQETGSEQTGAAGIAVVDAVAPAPTVNVTGQTNAAAAVASVSASQASGAITATAGLATVSAVATVAQGAVTAPSGIAVIDAIALAATVQIAGQTNANAGLAAVAAASLGVTTTVTVTAAIAAVPASALAATGQPGRNALAGVASVSALAQVPSFTVTVTAQVATVEALANVALALDIKPATGVFGGTVTLAAINYGGTVTTPDSEYGGSLTVLQEE